MFKDKISMKLEIVLNLIEPMMNVFIVHLNIYFILRIQDVLNWLIIVSFIILKNLFWNVKNVLVEIIYLISKLNVFKVIILLKDVININQVKNVLNVEINIS